MRKPQSNSVLKNLPAKQQQELWEFLSKEGNGTRQAVAFVKKKFGKKTYESSVSVWHSWYPFSKQLEDFKGLTDEITAILTSNPDLDLDSEKVSKAGQAIFEAMAARKQDSKLFIELRKLRLKDREQLLDREKFAESTCETYLKWSKDERSRKIANSNISHTEKIKQLRKIHFADIDALQKSGKVKLPT